MDLRIDSGSDSDYGLELGYSGSPVVDAESGYVLGIVIQREGQNKGLAISINAVEKIWPEILSLFDKSQIQDELKIVQQEISASKAEILSGQQNLKGLQDTLDLLTPQIELGTPLEFKPVLKWLDDRETLAKKAGKYVLDNYPEVGNCLLEKSSYIEKEKQRFYEELEDCLSLIYYRFFLDNRNLLETPDISPYLLQSAYEEAFRYIKNRIPEYLDREVATEVRSSLDYLLRRLF